MATWSNITESIVSWLNTSENTATYTNTEKNGQFEYLLQEEGDYILQEEGGFITLEGIFGDNLQTYVNQTEN